MQSNRSGACTTQNPCKSSYPPNTPAGETIACPRASESRESSRYFPWSTTAPPGHTDPKSQDLQYETAQHSSHATKNNLSTQQLRNLHIALKHATKAGTKDYLRSAGLWTTNTEENLDTVLSSFVCQLAKPLPRQPIVSTRPPDYQKQREICIDVIFFEQSPFLHCVDRATGWSEVGFLRHRSLEQQILIFKRIHVYRHGPFQS